MFDSAIRYTLVGVLRVLIESSDKEAKAIVINRSVFNELKTKINQRRK